jgi:hypothetical protein
VSTTGGDADDAWRELVTARARQVVVVEDPYDPASRIGEDINRVLIEPEFAGSHDRAGSVMALWLGLTDAVDGPPAYARGLARSDIDQLMRRAANEWLALDADTQSVDVYIRRWNAWSDLV